MLNNLDAETIILAIASLLMVGMLVYWHFDSKTSIDIRSAFTKNGEFSLMKFGQLIALAVSTWIIIYQTRNNRLTDWLFTGYMIAWSGANLIQNYMNRGSTPPYGGSSYSGSNYNPSAYNSGPTYIPPTMNQQDEPPLTPAETEVKKPLDFRSLRKNR